jgi:hypothetical protein
MIGFAGNSALSSSYCAKNADQACCQNVGGAAQPPTDAGYESDEDESFENDDPENYTDDDENYEPFQALLGSTAKKVGTEAAVGAGNSGKKLPIAAIIGGAVGAVVLITIGTVMYVRRRKSQQVLKQVSIADKTADSHAVKLKCIVKYAYSPNLPDEMELQVGDLVVFESLSDDGWGDARNLTSGEEGKACTRFMEPVE